LESISCILVSACIRMLGSKLMSEEGYTQREWDRTVGWGKVPDEYKKKPIPEYIGPEPVPDFDEDD